MEDQKLHFTETCFAAVLGSHLRNLLVLFLAAFVLLGVTDFPISLIYLLKSLYMPKWQSRGLGGVREARETEAGSAPGELPTNGFVTSFLQELLPSLFPFIKPILSDFLCNPLALLFALPSPSFLCCSSPVHRNGRHGVDAGEHRCDGKEILEAAVVGAEVPLAVQRIDEVD